MSALPPRRYFPGHTGLYCDATTSVCASVPRAARKGNKAMIVSWILSKIRNYLQYRETVAELSRLTDRELEDLGISRYEIESVARYHGRG